MSCGHTHKLPLPPTGDDSQTGRLADALALDIHLGRIAPGQPLREVEIAEAHDVSRTIVRAALQRLEAMGLAEITLNKGARVRQPDAEAAEDMVELHVQLMTLAARSAARRAEPEQLSLIGEFVQLMEDVPEAGIPADDFQRLRIGFNRALFVAAGDVLSERLRTTAPATPHHARARDDIATREGQGEVAKAARELLRAIEAGAPDTAAAAAERMLRHHAEQTLTVRPGRTLV